MIFTFLWSWFEGIARWFPWKQKHGKPSTHYHVENDFHFPGNRTGGKDTRNKAYFDQHQKAPHNRRRKLSKAMRNLYKLEGR